MLTNLNVRLEKFVALTTLEKLIQVIKNKMHFNDLPLDIIKMILCLALKDDTIININNMKLLSKKVCKAINQSHSLYHGKYGKWWYEEIVQKKRGFRSARLHEGPDCGTFTYEPPLHPYDPNDVEWWWYSVFDENALKPKRLQQVRFMDARDDKREIISSKAYDLWMNGYSNDPNVNWAEAKRRLPFIWDE